MKRIFILLMGITTLLTSCNTVNRTARTAYTQDNLKSVTVVDIIPTTEHRITHTLHPNAKLLRGGEDNVKQAVEHEALIKYGNADILLEPQYIVEKKRGLFITKISSITVSGRPAYYANYRKLHDSVWTNPAFNGLCYHPSHDKQCCNHTCGLRCHPAFDALNAPPFLKCHSHVENNKDSTYDPLTSSLTPTPTSTSNKGLTNGFSTFWGTEEGTSAFAVLLNVGYQLNPHLEIGAGIGPGFHNGVIDDIPFYGYARINLSKKTKHLFLDGKWGGNLLGMVPMKGFAFGYSFGKYNIAFQIFNYRSNKSMTPSSTEREIGISASYRF
ncbi:MAG: hypothetical protein IKY84_06025 [Bacteroidaceae bacterium]|nr:hypothetical protein [Bacteroidaceae bacterium]